MLIEFSQPIIRAVSYEGASSTQENGTYCLGGGLGFQQWRRAMYASFLVPSSSAPAQIETDHYPNDGCAYLPVEEKYTTVIVHAMYNTH